MTHHAEHAVMGAVLLKPTLVSEMDLLPEDFTLQSYTLAYQAVLEMVAANEVVDVVTVATKLDNAHPQANYLPILGAAARDCPSTANTVAYGAIVKNESRKRQAKAVVTHLLNTLDQAKDPMGVIDQTVRDLMQVMHSQHTYDASLSEVLQQSVTLIEAAFESDGTVGVPTGLQQLDAVLSGLHSSDLIVVGARPSMGKTAFLLNLADNAGVPSGIISAEQPHAQMGVRLIAIHGQVAANKMRTGQMSEADFAHVSQTIGQLHQRGQAWFYDKPAPSILDVIRQARVWKHLYNIQVLYVDYLQRIQWPDTTLPKHEQVGQVVMALKALARELDIPVVALAQVNREVEKRPNKRPRMGDLKDSGVIEQEADCILLLYRDEVYYEDSDQKGLIEIDVQKNRHGPTGFVCCYWLAQTMTVTDVNPTQRTHS